MLVTQRNLNKEEATKARFKEKSADDVPGVGDRGTKAQQHGEQKQRPQKAGVHAVRVTHRRVLYVNATRLQ